MFRLMIKKELLYSNASKKRVNYPFLDRYLERDWL